jgi:hypothetical protein
MAFEGYALIAKDGRLAFAGWWTCTGQVEFFNTLTPAEEAEVNGLYRAFRDQQTAARNAARMAFAGIAACAANEAIGALEAEMSRERSRLIESHTPYIQSFAREEFSPGDPVEWLTIRNPPTGSIRHGDSTTYFYESPDGELWVLTRGGQLVAALFYGDQIRGLALLGTPAEAQECSRIREKVLTERGALFAVAGFAAVNAPWILAPTDAQSGRAADE